jgi:hypothetical protein
MEGDLGLQDLPSEVDRRPDGTRSPSRPSLRPGSMLAISIHRCRHDSEMPRSLAISAIGLAARRVGSTGRPAETQVGDNGHKHFFSRCAYTHSAVVRWAGDAHGPHALAKGDRDNRCRGTSNLANGV